MNEKKNRLRNVLAVVIIIGTVMGFVFGKSIYELLIDWDIIPKPVPHPSPPPDPIPKPPPKPIPAPRPDIELTCFTCNYWEDLNNDTQMNWPKEFFGIKEIFFYHKDVELMVVAHIEKGKNKFYKKEIITPAGLTYAAHSNILSSNSIHLYSEHKIGELIDEGGEGYWKINHYIDSILYKVDSFALHK